VLGLDDGPVAGDKVPLPVSEEKIFEKIEIIIPPIKTTPMNVPHPIGLALTLAPQLGQVSAFELTSTPHSLHFMSAIPLSYRRSIN
jgi:hypothetical protein